MNSYSSTSTNFLSSSPPYVSKEIMAIPVTTSFSVAAKKKSLLGMKKKRPPLSRAGHGRLLCKQSKLKRMGWKSSQEGKGNNEIEIKSIGWNSESKSMNLEIEGEKISVGVATCQGKRNYMEDYHQLCTHNNQWCFMGVYDGHSGSLAAQIAANQLHRHIFRGLPTVPPSKRLRDIDVVDTSIEHAFKKIEETILNDTIKKGRNDGTTACIALIYRHELFVANVGDSRAVLGGVVKHDRMSVDHKPNNIEEEERIRQSGGHVMHSGCWRVAHENIPFRLAVSRSLGDHCFKRNLPKSCTAPLISAKPFIKSTSLTKDDHFLIVASDGIWDRLSDAEAVTIVQLEIEKAKKELSISTSESLEIAANRLIEVAYSRNSTDNTTVLIMAFPWI